jgi:hypothetical protein
MPAVQAPEVDITEPSPLDTLEQQAQQELQQLQNESIEQSEPVEATPVPTAPKKQKVKSNPPPKSMFKMKPWMRLEK